MEEKEKSKIVQKLDNLDDRINAKGKFWKNVWQLGKFGIVSTIITVIQLGLLYLMYFLMKSWTEPLPGFLAAIFSESTVGKDHANWGYVLPFFLSNFIANTKQVFKSLCGFHHWEGLSISEFLRKMNSLFCFNRSF